MKRKKEVKDVRLIIKVRTNQSKKREGEIKISWQRLAHQDFLNNLIL